MNLLLGLFCLLLGGVPAFAFPVDDVPPQCADPTYACQDLQSARLCKTVSACIHDVWAAISPPEDNDEICDICKEMVKEARDQLLSNMTQEEIKEVFEGSCKLLPIKIVANACIKVVDEIIPELVEMLASRMDPTMVCTISGMCYASKDEHSLENHILKFVKTFVIKPKETQCEECTKMLADVQTFLNSTPEADVKKYLEQFCGEKIPHYICNIVMNTYFSDIYTLIKTTDPAKLCGSVGICPQKCKIQTRAGDDLTCEFCEHLLQHMKDLITTNTTLDEFKTALLNFCKQTGKFSDKCTALVNEYFEMIFNYIKQLDTKGLCTLMGLCGNTSSQPLIELTPAHYSRKPMIKLIPATPMRIPLHRVHLKKMQMLESNDIFIPALLTPRAQEKPFCALCQDAMEEVEKELADPDTKQKLESFLSQVCNLLPSSWRDDCTNFISQNVDAVIDTLEQELQPNVICPALGLCSVARQAAVPQRIKDLECDVCKDVVTSFRNKLQDPSSKIIVQTFLEEACARLPDSVAAECKKFVDENIDTVMAIIIEELDPQQVCAILKICPDSQRIAAIPIPRVSGVECTVCKSLVSEVEKLIKNKDTKAAVEAALDQACSVLPSSLSKSCKDFVDKYADILITFAVEELDPEHVCAFLGICTNQVVRAPPKVQDIKCDLCKEVVQEVENLVKDKKTEDEIRSALDRVCGLLPSSVATRCTSFVDKYTDLIVQLLLDGLDPAALCAELKLCPEDQNLECETCKEALHFVQEKLMDPDTQGEVKNVLKRVCDLLPLSSLATNCEAFVDEYGAALLSLVAQEIDPSALCFELRMCQNVTMEKRVSLDECSLCTTLVDRLDELLEEDDVDRDIARLAERACGVLPSSLRARCGSFVEAYGPYLLQMIGQMADSRQVCQDIKFCSP